MAKTDVRTVIINEYKRCKEDPVYFMKKYCYIQHPQRGQIPFKLFPFQEDVLRLYRDEKFLITLKSRQLGISTLSAGYALWLMLFNKDKNILALATTQTTARNLVTKTIYMYENLPKWLRIKHVEKNKLSLRLKNGSRIIAKSSNTDAARSEAVSLLLIDEAAFIDNIGETFTAAQQTLATGGQCMVLSCVTKETYVTTDKGIQQVGDFVSENTQPGFNTVGEYNIQGEGKKRSSNLFYDNGEVKTKKIKTRYSELEGSENHKLYASTEKGYRWYRLDELKEGDFLNVQGGYRQWGDNNQINFVQKSSKGRKPLEFRTDEITPELAYLIGLYIAEGSSDNKHSIDIVCGDSQDIDKQFRKLKLNYSEQETALGKRICNTNLVELLKEIGLDLTKTANRKKIPKRILGCSEDVLIGLLQGLFDGDGTVTEKGVIGYTTVSKELSDQIRAILLNLGIYTNQYVRTAKDANTYIEKSIEEGKAWAKDWNKHRYDAFILEAYGRDVEKFKELVGFKISRKQSKLEKYVELRKTKTRTNCKEVIPNSRNLIIKLHERSKLSQNKFAKKTGRYLSNILNRTTKRFTENVSRDLFEDIYRKWRHLLTEEEQKYWDGIASKYSRWVPVSEIREGRAHTYDFSLPEDSEDVWCHSVLYNGILGHQTPNGVGNWFHQTWEKAKNKENSFIPIKLKWDVHPERDIHWRKQQDRDLGKRMASQECDCSFLASGETVFEPKDLTYYEQEEKQTPVEKRGVDGNLWIWKEVDYSKNYMVVADVARGDASDYSTFHILDIESCEQIGEYKGKLSPKDFGNVLVGIASEYNDALLVVENANIGWSTIEQIQERGYRNLYHSSNSKNENVESYMRKYERKQLTPGFTNSTKTRPLLIAKLIEYVSERDVRIKSSRLLTEMRVFVWKNGKAQAQSGYNDDLVMAFAIGLYVRDSALRLKAEGTQAVKAQLSSMAKINRKPGIFRSKEDQKTFRNTDKREKTKKAVYGMNKNPYIVNTGKSTEDYRWLF